MHGFTFFLIFITYQDKKFKNNISEFLFCFTHIFIATLICYIIKIFYPIDPLILDIYNKLFPFFILNLILFSTFFITINFKALKLNHIFIYYLILFSLKNIFLSNFENIFLLNSIIYFLFFVFNIIFNKSYQNFIHKVDFSGKTNFLLFFLKEIDLKSHFDFFDIFFTYGILIFKGFKYLLINFLINKFGIINNVSSFLLVNIILDLCFIPSLSIILNEFIIIKNYNKKNLLNICLICIIIQTIISAFLYFNINYIVHLFNFENGILNYCIYIFKILIISTSFTPIQYIFPIYCYTKNKKVLVIKFLSDIFILLITILFLVKFRLNGIFFTIPISIIISNLILLILYKFNNAYISTNNKFI